MYKYYMSGNYANGKIYKLTSPSCDKVYVGSTILPLPQRLSRHKNCYKMYLDGKFKYITSYEIIKNGNFKIELLESYPCNTKKELTDRERHWIDTTNCINKVLPGRTKKEWYLDNKTLCLRRQKEYDDQRRPKLRAYHRNYYKINKDKLSAKRMRSKLITQQMMMENIS